MNCKMCGELLDERAKFCPVCGARQAQPEASAETAVLNPIHSHEEDCSHEGYVGSRGSVSFIEAFKLFFLRYTDYKGRSRRSEYWWASLATSIISAFLSTAIPDFAWIWSLVILVPSITICIRRLHDIGKSGWWYLINFIPMVGQIIFLIFMCKDSTGDNIWGPNPKY